MPLLNPFKPIEKLEPKVKCLVFGAAGVGKTYLALTSPGRIAVIDTEGGTAFYAGRKGLSASDVMPAKTYRDVRQAVSYLVEHPSDYATLVIDPVTVIYETLQEAAQVHRSATNARKGRGAVGEDADLEMLDWARIKRFYKALMTELVNLPLHVIVTARERDDVVMRGGEPVKVGVRPDAEKGTPYYFDTVVRLVANGQNRDAVVLKDRTGTHALNATLENPTFTALFGAVLKGAKGTAPSRKLQDDSDAAAVDATVMGAETAPAALVAKLVTTLHEAAIDADRLRAERGYPPFEELPADKVAQLLVWAEGKAEKAREEAARPQVIAMPLEERAPEAVSA